MTCFTVPLFVTVVVLSRWWNHIIKNIAIHCKGTVKQVNYDVKTDTTSVVEKASDSVVGVVVYKNTTNNAFGFGDNSSSSSETQSGSGSGVVYDKTGKYTYIITNHHVIDGANKVQVVFL